MSDANGATALVCGFWDETKGVVGIGWDLGGTRGGAVAIDGAVAPRSAELVDHDQGVRIALASRATRIEATLSPRPPAAGGDEAGAAEGDPRIAPCAAHVEVMGNARRFEGAGQVTRWARSPIEGIGLFRHLAIPAPDGGLLVAAAARELDRSDHAAERTAAWLIDAGGRATRFSEALLSTQYDAEGRQTRIGLELWPEDPEAPAMRAAATALGVAEADGVFAAPMRSSVEGTTGLGAYLIWRP
ncbi:MAG TPA: hypothetical protein VHH72_03210 [Solirubrobacterales bacterium]|jgi:hypothetical protein|nr:hypothetical protein [Solirubrobacterales bacterium]